MDDGRVQRCRKKFDLEILFDPFEKQFDLPALFVENYEFLGRAAEIIYPSAQEQSGRFPFDLPRIKRIRRNEIGQFWPLAEVNWMVYPLLCSCLPLVVMI